MWKAVLLVLFYSFFVFCATTIIERCALAVFMEAMGQLGFGSERMTDTNFDIFVGITRWF
jgi:hypothetical protein